MPFHHVLRKRALDAWLAAGGSRCRVPITPGLDVLEDDRVGIRHLERRREAHGADDLVRSPRAGLAAALALKGGALALEEE